MFWTRIFPPFTRVADRGELVDGLDDVEVEGRWEGEVESDGDIDNPVEKVPVSVASELVSAETVEAVVLVTIVEVVVVVEDVDSVVLSDPVEATVVPTESTALDVEFVEAGRFSVDVKSWLAVIVVVEVVPSLVPDVKVDSVPCGLGFSFEIVPSDVPVSRHLLSYVHFYLPVVRVVLLLVGDVPAGLVTVLETVVFDDVDICKK